MREKVFLLDLKSKANDIKGYYEISENYLSKGKGGLNSFSVFYDNNEKIGKGVDSYNTFFIVGKNKVSIE